MFDELFRIAGRGIALTAFCVSAGAGVALVGAQIATVAFQARRFRRARPRG